MVTSRIRAHRLTKSLCAETFADHLKQLKRYSNTIPGFTTLLYSSGKNRHVAENIRLLPVSYILHPASLRTKRRTPSSILSSSSGFVQTLAAQHLITLVLSEEYRRQTFASTISQQCLSEPRIYSLQAGPGLPRSFLGWSLRSEIATSGIMPIQSRRSTESMATPVVFRSLVANLKNLELWTAQRKQLASEQ